MATDVVVVVVVVVIVVCCCGCCCCGFYFIIVSVSLSKSKIFKNRRRLLLLMPDFAPAAAFFVSASDLLRRTVNPRLGTVPSCSPRGCQRRQFTPQTATAGSPPGPSSEMCKDGAATTRNPRSARRSFLPQTPSRMRGSLVGSTQRQINKVGHAADLPPIVRGPVVALPWRVLLLDK